MCDVNIYVLSVDRVQRVVLWTFTTKCRETTRMGDWPYAEYGGYDEVVSRRLRVGALSKSNALTKRAKSFGEMNSPVVQPDPIHEQVQQQQ